jgi:TRAP-type transport system periplasmic protein
MVRARAAGVAIVLLLGGVLAPPAAGQTVVKLATLVPDGSVWHRILLDQAAEWKRASEGRVEVRIYPGGVAGDDPDMVRKMRVGQFQAAALGVAGLVEIDDAFKVFQVPFFFESVDELFHVLGAMEPLLRQRLEAKGFVLLNWSYAGWVHLYSRRPVRTVADLRAQKMFMWGADDRSLRLWRSQGLQPVGLAATDIMMSLQTGMIEAIATTPLAVLSLQWHRLAPYQLDQGIAPLIGATVMTRRGFNMLSERDRPALVAASRRVGERLRAEIPPQEVRAVAELQGRGLTVTSIAPDGRATWDSAGREFSAAHRGVIVPQDAYDQALRARDEYRRRAAASSLR